MQEYAQRQIRSGAYANLSEVVRAGIRLLMEKDGAHQFYALKADLERASADAEAGECEPFDPKAFEPAAQFYDRLASTCGTDIHLDAIIREGRKPHAG